MSIELTVIVRDKTFILSEDQIKSDEPSLFTEFIDNHPETPRPSMRFSRNPCLFSLILDHLCGYTILPIHDANIPHGMTQETALKNLKADAVHYKLEKLVNSIEIYQQTLVPANIKSGPDKPKDPPTNLRISPFFHFPGRVTSIHRYWDDTPSAFVELPFSIDLTRNFTIALWYRTFLVRGRITILSLDAPYESTPHELFQISIGPEQDFQLEIAISGTSDSDRLSLGSSTTTTPLNVWNHLAFVQQIGEDGSIDRRTLYINGIEVLKSPAKAHIYNPGPSQIRMALMRGCWDRKRTSGFLGQIENITLFRRALDQEELINRGSKEHKPAVHGGPIADSEDHEWDYDSVY
ncbi:unnamed protein product [Rhizoctonia solani]|uniref:BTB domain-containing protein n=1 Tax=Rhizoctonia solani TaxID=456999 RepID=A0A8H3HSR2_9AGAM|nr:unnamed protein product [Rhizoctonia solani]